MMPTDDSNRDLLRPNPSAKKTPRAADDLTRLAHELSSLLDGSIRWLALADRNLAAAHTDLVEQARRQLDTVRSALVRMADLVQAALQSRHLSLGSPILGRAMGTSLADAFAHAIDVVRPRAEELAVTVILNVDSAAGATPSGPIYSVILNGLCNAIDSIETVQQIQPGGAIHVTARLEHLADGRTWITIEIADDGAGLKPDTEPDRFFEPRFTTKHGPRGVGLAVCRNLINELQGTIELTNRPDRSGKPRPGAILRVRYPEPSAGDESIGGPS